MSKKQLLSVISLCLALLSCHTLIAQDIHVSQFYETPLLRNPALAGIFTGDVRVQVLHRNQWSWTGHPYKTTTLSGEYKFPVGQNEDFLTLGLQGYYDLAGSSRLRTTQLMPALNYHKSLSSERNEYLSAGFSVGMVQRQFDARNLTFDYQYRNGSFNPGNPTGEDFAAYSRSFMDVAAGISYSNELGEGGNFYLGASLAHVNKPTETFKQERIVLPNKLQLHGGISANLDEQFSLRSEINYTNQNSFNELMVGALVTYQPADLWEANSLTSFAVSGGVMTRINDAVIPVVKLRFQQIELGFSYDVNISSLKTVSQGKGGFELTFAYRAFTRAAEEAGRVRCPRF